MKKGSFIYDRQKNRYLKAMGNCIDPSAMTCLVYEKTEKGYGISENIVMPEDQFRRIALHTLSPVLCEIQEGRIDIKQSGFYSSDDGSWTVYDLVRFEEIVGTMETGKNGLTIKIGQDTICQDIEDKAILNKIEPVIKENQPPLEEKEM